MLEMFLVFFSAFMGIGLAIINRIGKREADNRYDAIANQQVDYSHHDARVNRQRVERQKAADRVNGRVNRFVAKGGTRQ